jgi:hypothetical protein
VPENQALFVWFMFNLGENRVVVEVQRAAPLREMSCLEHEPVVFRHYLETRDAI